MRGTRSRGRVVSAPFRLRNYRTLAGAIRTYTNPVQVLWRYVTNSGDYPYCISIRTPMGKCDLELYSFHDLRTVNEVFSRIEYPADARSQVVVDLGANIGISGAYFATRSNSVRAYCYEPSPVNINRLGANLAQFGDRVVIVPKAVGPASGRFTFNAEPTGRYGGLALPEYTRPVDHPVEVDVLAIDTVLRDLLEQEGHIDVLKIDTEDSEVPLIGAISEDVLRRIGVIYLETIASRELRPGVLEQRQRGEICVLRPVAAHTDAGTA